MVMMDLVFCKDCSSRNSWVRQSTKDWTAENGKIVEYAYRCSVCGKITLRPVEVESVL